MSDYSSYKGLELPESTEKYNVQVFNKNNTIIDSELHKLDLKNESQDNLLATKEALNLEISRATTKENEIIKSLSDEITRSKTSENDIKTALSEEIDRVLSAEENNRDDLIAHTLDKSNPHAVTKEQIDLGNVDNTSDINKPISTAQQNALDAVLLQSNQYTDTQIADLVDGAPETLDTLKEVADAIAENETVTDALNAAIGTKANQTELDTHIGNDVIHVTQPDKDTWNDANEKKHSHENKSILDSITSALIVAWNNAVAHISDTIKHITSDERNNWNYAKEHADSPHAPHDAEKNIITSIQKNGVDLPVSDDQKVNIEISTNLSSFDNDIGYISEENVKELLSDYSKTEEVQELIDQSIAQIPDSRDGLSAYEIALSHGFSGTEEEWMMSLNGKNGLDGVNGLDGKDGSDGINGFSPEIVPDENNSDTVYKLNIVTSTNTFTTPNLRGNDGTGSDISVEYIENLIQETTGGAKIAQNEEGKWGYIPAGADTVIPFSSGSGNIGGTSDINYLKLGTIAQDLPGTLWIENDSEETIPEQVDTVAILSTVSSDLENSISCTDGEKYLIGDIFLNTQDTGEIGCCWIE